MELEVGKRKATYRVRIIDLESGKSKTFSIYQRGKKKSLSELTAKIIETFRQ